MKGKDDDVWYRLRRSPSPPRNLRLLPGRLLPSRMPDEDPPDQQDRPGGREELPAGRLPGHPGGEGGAVWKGELEEEAEGRQEEEKEEEDLGQCHKRGRKADAT